MKYLTTLMLLLAAPTFAASYPEDFDNHTDNVSTGFCVLLFEGSGFQAISNHDCYAVLLADRAIRVAEAGSSGGSESGGGDRITVLSLHPGHVDAKFALARIANTEANIAVAIASSQEFPLGFCDVRIYTASFRSASDNTMLQLADGTPDMPAAGESCYDVYLRSTQVVR